MREIIENDEMLQRLTGLTQPRFQSVVETFEAISDARYWSRTVQGRRRQRGRGAGLKSILRDAESMVFFTLFYYRHRPSQKAMAEIFGMTQQCASQWVNHLTPMVAEAFGQTLGRHEKPLHLTDLLSREPMIAVLQDRLIPLLPNRSRQPRRPRQRRAISPSPRIEWCDYLY